MQRSGIAAPLVDVLFGRRSPRFASTQPSWQPLNAGLDGSQRGAVQLALAAQDVALIHGVVCAGLGRWVLGAACLAGACAVRYGAVGVL